MVTTREKSATEAKVAEASSSGRAAKQPIIPSVKCETPFTKEKLNVLLHPIKALIGTLVGHYSAPRPTGQASVKWPAVFVLRKAPNGKHCMVGMHSLSSCALCSCCRNHVVVVESTCIMLHQQLQPSSQYRIVLAHFCPAADDERGGSASHSTYPSMQVRVG